MNNTLRGMFTFRKPFHQPEVGEMGRGIINWRDRPFSFRMKDGWQWIDSRERVIVIDLWLFVFRYRWLTREKEPDAK